MTDYKDFSHGEDPIAPQPPKLSISEEARVTLLPVKNLLLEDEDPFRKFRNKSAGGKVWAFITGVFPVLSWLPAYQLEWLVGDIIAGLTISSLAVPQSLAYAKLANLPPVNGLYCDFVPPLIYFCLGSSRHITVGPVAVVSILMGQLLSKEYDPVKQKKQYLQLAFSTTFYAGVIQFGLGFLRLGFIVDYLSHATVVGFMAGAAITIGLSQMKSVLGYKTFTNKNDVVHVFHDIFTYTDQFEWHTFVIAISFLVFLVILKQLAKYFKGNRFFFFLNCSGPLVSVIVSTVMVYATRADKKGVKIVGHIKKGVPPSSIDHLHLAGEEGLKALKHGIVAGLIALAEAIAIGRTFAALKGYQIDGGKEMMAFGVSNICSSFTSGYVCTGSFSRSAVNYAAGANTAVTQLILSLVCIITLVAITPLFKYLPNAALAAIIINAVSGLVDIQGAWKVYKADKLDFIALLGAFFGVLFVSIEIGLLISVCICILRLIIIVSRPHTAILGRIPSTTIYRSVMQYPQAQTQDGVAIMRVDAPIYFANANFIREKITRLAYRAREDGLQIEFLILEITPVSDIDTSGIHQLEELHRTLQKNNIQLGLSNPSKLVLQKLDTSGFIELIGEQWLFLSAHEAVKVCTSLRNKKTVAEEP
eukprot:TRINITY_DN7262_c0_g1_i1.p1 TRINITY_DN7262_c0_g1~~TRINITY_DN7262_c0_g1_i1.p1  ORF type:complete len:645 (+),score=178.94 TRINITY_DN7262_c0_g1_i1:120-2054(+)